MGKCLLPAHWCILQSLQNNFYPIKSFTTERYMQQYLAFFFFSPATALKLSSCNNTMRQLVMTSRCMLPIAMQNHCRCQHAALRSHTPTSPRDLKKKTYVGFEPKISHPSIGPLINTTQHTTIMSLQRIKHCLFHNRCPK